MTRRYGVIADDFTGACDLAGQVATAGADVVVVTSVDALHAAPAATWTVVATKTRTSPAVEAVATSVTAARALHAAGATWLYQKYCSTFDSTPAGNIGPVADALVDLLDDAAPGTPSVTTPATPSIRRTVRDGLLLVDGTLLEHSSMRDHPLTPMRRSNVRDLLAAQSRRTVVGVGRHPDARALDRPGTHVVVDAVDDADLDRLASVLITLGRPVLTGGGAGLAAALARAGSPARGAGAFRSARDRIAPSPGLVLAGSCSTTTLAQLAASTLPMHRIDVEHAVVDPRGCTDRALAAVAGLPYAVVAASASPAETARARERFGRDVAAAAIEEVLATVAVGASRAGVRRFVVAGGETSGAVTAALGARTLAVGPEIDPGVPWTVALDADDGPTALLLKSGSLGRATLIDDAWALL